MTNRAAPPSRPPTRRSAAVTAEQQSTSARRTPDDPSGRANRDAAIGGRTAAPTYPGNRTGDRDRDDVDDEEEGFANGPTGNTHNANASSDRTSTRETSTTKASRDSPTKSRYRSGHPAGHSSTPQTMEIAVYDQLVRLIVFSRSATIGQRLRARVGDPASEGLPGNQ